MRTEQLLTIGVAGLAAYALYRLMQASPQPLPAPPGPPNATPPPILLPSRAGLVPTPPAGTLVTVPKDLHPQFWYAGRIETFGTAAQNLTQAGLVQLLESVGFGGSAVRPDAPEAATLPLHVQVFTDPGAASRLLPAWSLTDPGVGTRWFYGRWTGNAPSNGVPSLVRLMWRAKSPTGGGF
jgi:hypothetical protein